jgi:hypothetical protein
MEKYWGAALQAQQFLQAIGVVGRRTTGIMLRIILALAATTYSGH